MTVVMATTTRKRKEFRLTTVTVNRIGTETTTVEGSIAGKMITTAIIDPRGQTTRTGVIAMVVEAPQEPGSYPTVNERTPVEIPFFGRCEGICPHPKLKTDTGYKRKIYRFALWCGWEGACARATTGIGSTTSIGIMIAGGAGKRGNDLPRGYTVGGARTPTLTDRNV